MDTSQQPRRTFLGMPGYGDISAGAARGFYRASESPQYVSMQYNEGSLLAQNFNALWCTALNLKQKGASLDYFAMQHADISPQPGWLDVLIEELEDRDLDVLSVVVPIKSVHGLTSTAMDSDDRSAFHPMCRLTMTEIFDLPETFTSDDLGHPLLINTGLWICRLNMDWAPKLHFTVNDRLVQVPDGRYMAEVEPEDWYFSRLCHELGLKVGATRKVRVAHQGKHVFVNSHPWGSQQFDQEYVKESVLDVGKPDGWRFPYDVPGWLLPEEGLALARLAEGKLVLEVGSYCGKSTICMAQTAAQVVSVDPHDGRGTSAPQDTEKQLRGNLAQFGVADKVAVVKGTFHSSEDSDQLFDLIFLDGSHDLESIQQDLTNARRILKEDGLIAVHDYREKPGDYDGSWDPGVTEAVNKSLESGDMEFVSRHATIVVLRPKELVPA